MFAIDPILDVLLMSKERLMQAREHYTPVGAPLTADASFTRWTQRVSVQSELGSAREIASLSDDDMSAMEAEFLRCPNRQRPARVRLAIPLGAAVTGLGVIGLLAHSLVGSFGSSAQPIVQTIGATCFLVGVAILAIGFLWAFGNLHLEVSHGTTGLYFGRLDEHHPWLSKALSLGHHPAAEEYRQRVLRERGWLRGVDVVLMKEIVRVQDALDQTMPARQMAEKVQLLPAPVRNSAKPRLVSTRRESKAKLAVSGDSAVKPFAAQG
ncbi:MAG: hypothetical protein ABIV63_02985 [Caldimonas sp.]